MDYMYIDWIINSLMTRIGKVVRKISDLREFYIQVGKEKK
jgi:hypothetical protein